MGCGSGCSDTCLCMDLRFERLSSRACIWRVGLLNCQVVVGSDNCFTFDYVFSLDSAQAQIYDDCVSPLVEGAALFIALRKTHILANALFWRPNTNCHKQLHLKDSMPPFLPMDKRVPERRTPWEV